MSFKFDRYSENRNWTFPEEIRLETERIVKNIVEGGPTGLECYAPRHGECDSPRDIVVDDRLINNYRYLNRHFIEVNNQLADKGIYVCGFNGAIGRRTLFLKRYGKIFGWFFYFFDFIWHRACPKLPFTKKFYFFVNRKIKRVYARQEVLGRLYFCGFELIDNILLNRTHYYVVCKVKEPSTDPKPTYGPIARLNRVGKDGKIIEVHKIRTMYAYSEYLQSYVFERNGMSDSGKLARDFRLTGWGRFLRKYFIDELPMLFYNVLWKHNMKIVGVRPLSEQYFSLYSEEMRRYRIKSKPGLLPPFYISKSNKETIEKIEEGEKEYLDRYFKRPFATDFKYFWKILFSIIFRGKHSN